MVSVAVKHIRSMEQKRDPRTRPTQICPNFIFDKGAKATEWRRESLSTKGAGATGHPQAKSK